MHNLKTQYDLVIDETYDINVDSSRFLNPIPMKYIGTVDLVGGPVYLFMVDPTSKFEGLIFGAIAKWLDARYTEVIRNYFDSRNPSADKSDFKFWYVTDSKHILFDPLERIIEELNKEVK